MRDDLKLYHLDKDGNPQEVKIIRDQPIFAVDHASLPKFSMGEITFRAEVDPESMKAFTEMLAEHDQKILAEYDKIEKAMEVCIRGQECHKCPYFADDVSCVNWLIDQLKTIIRNQKELHRQTMMMSKVKK